jgi:tetratricopeptide (TPR) repeat protein/4-amino-4-deoxy-L-arabinose transferase-like glycosyltransferase
MELPANSAYRETSGGSEPTLLARLKDYRIWLVCLMFVMIGAFALDDTMLYTPDCARYLIWAKSLASFEGFKDATAPETVRYVVHAPLYSVLLAPVAWLTSNTILGAKIFTLFTGLLVLILFYLWVSKRAGRSAAVTAALFLALNPLILLFSIHVLSDIAFAICVILVFVLVERILTQPRSDEKTAWMLALILTAGIFLREVGFMLLLSVVCFFLLKKDRQRALLAFTIPVFFYLIWYFRNEIIVAGLENPPLRNSRLFSGHFFTLEDAGLTEELLARFKTNLSVYAEMGKGLLLFPQYFVRPFPVVSSTDPMMGAMTSMLRYAQYPLAVLQYGLFGWGIVGSWKKEPNSLLFLLFLFFYLPLILLYPFNDIRFLVPFLLAMLYFVTLGALDLYKRLLDGRVGRNLLFLGSGLAGLLLLEPNVVWNYNLVRDSQAYLREVRSSFADFEPGGRAPELYTKPFPLVGKWISEHSDPSTVVAARWKEMAFWLQGRKLLEMEPLLPLTLFETLLRDYNIEYLVVLVSHGGVREMEFQMQQSNRFSFETTFRAGNLEVIKVHYEPLDLASARVTHPDEETEPPLKIESPSGANDEEKVRSLYRLGVRLLEKGEYARAGQVFEILWGVTGGSGSVVLLRAVAMEFVGQLVAADELFDRFRHQPQAGSFLKHAWYHQQLISLLRRAEEDTSHSSKAMLYHMLSANYWDLGFRHRALEMLQRALQVDSTFSPALIFGAYYALQEDDYTLARDFVVRLKSADSLHLMMRPLQSLFLGLDSLRAARNVEERTTCRLKIGKRYAAIGLSELAIDQVLLLLRENPDNHEALRALADLYEKKRRNVPALEALRRLLDVEPTNAVAREKLDSLQSLQ